MQRYNETVDERYKQRPTTNAKHRSRFDDCNDVYRLVIVAVLIDPFIAAAAVC